MELTQERLKELLHYDPDTGEFTRKVFRSHLAKKGDIAGSIDNLGYIRIHIGNKRYRAHRLAWFYMYGEFQNKNTDHINGIKTDNRICNLREATRSENNQNQTKARTNNKSTGLLGASFFKRDCTFVAKIKLNGKSKHLGYFKTAEEAHERYLQEKRIIHPFGEI